MFVFHLPFNIEPVSFYPAKITERFQQPKNAGKLEDANAVGTSASFVCGVFLRVYLLVEIKTKQILEAKFKSNGCGFAIAAADALIDKIVGKKLTEFHGLDRKFLQSQFEEDFGEFPASREHCLDLIFEVLQSAFSNFRTFQIEEFSGEKALVCTCFGVTVDEVESAIDKDCLETVEQVTEICGAGGGCGSCQPLIQEILDVLQDENYAIIENN